MLEFNLKTISNFFYNQGALLTSQNTKDLNHLNLSTIISIFEKNGIIIFREFDYNIEDINNFTDKFTFSYSNDATRRKKRFNKENIRNVDSGIKEIELHSEASFTTSWPEIIWFICVSPPSGEGGRTKICDGITLWEKLSPKTKSFFISNELLYKVAIPIPIIKKNDKPNKEWYIATPGIKNSYLNYQKGTCEFELARYAVHESRIPGKLCFANHLLVSVESEPQLISRKLLNGKEIPVDVISEINNKANDITYYVNWKKYDIIMLDNKRFLHGREKIFSDQDTRDIINIQSFRASFGFASTTKIKLS